MTLIVQPMQLLHKVSSGGVITHFNACSCEDGHREVSKQPNLEMHFCPLESARHVSKRVICPRSNVYEPSRLYFRSVEFTVVTSLLPAVARAYEHTISRTP